MLLYAISSKNSKKLGGAKEEHGGKVSHTYYSFIKFLSFPPPFPLNQIYQALLAASKSSQSRLHIRKFWGAFKKNPRLGHIPHQRNQDICRGRTGHHLLSFTSLGNSNVQARLKAMD